MAEIAAPPRFLPGRAFPSYAYLPGRFPHPVRDLGGHSHGLPAPELARGELLGSEEYLWGLDLFNHGYYWEAHEAWESLWQAAQGQQRLFLKGMILLCASGVKVREGKTRPALRHARRAAEMFLLLPEPIQLDLVDYIGVTPSEAASMAISTIVSSPGSTDPGSIATPAFSFVLLFGQARVSAK